MKSAGRPWPRVAVLVPVTGAAAGLAGRLQALLSQDYPAYQVVFTTRDAHDPATAVILSLIRRYPGPGTWSAARPGAAARRITTCWRPLKFAGRTPELLVFCDSNQEAPTTGSRNWWRPSSAGKVEVTSGFHHVLAGEPGSPPAAGPSWSWPCLSPRAFGV